MMINNKQNATSVLPTPVSQSAKYMTAAAKRYKYLRKLLKFHQMDFEFALWQMFYLFIAPQKVYRNFYYRKQTKSQFARDDPAFLVLLTIWLIGSSIVFSFVLHFNFSQFLKFTLYVIFVDCIGVGVCIATSLWYLSNKYLKKKTCEDQDVEWGYAFDVHLNAFFPLLVILHVFQLFFYNGFWLFCRVELLENGLTICCDEVLFFRHFADFSAIGYAHSMTLTKVITNHDWFVSLFFGNTLWVIAVGYYIYITFLGYSSLPILQRTHVLLFPLTILAVSYLVTLTFKWNLSQNLMLFYKHRVL